MHRVGSGTSLVSGSPPTAWATPCPSLSKDYLFTVQPLSAVLPRILTSALGSSYSVCPPMASVSPYREHSGLCLLNIFFPTF